MKIKKRDIKKYWKKFWYIIWKDESLKGWIISLAVLFIFIKFIFFPVLSLVTGTTLPLAIVESCSMYHEGNLFSDYGKWWQKHDGKYEEFNIDKEEFEDFSFKNGFNKGDILFVIGAKPEKLKIGDVIIFDSGTKGSSIIHRIIKIRQEDGQYIFSTIGDNNKESFSPDQPVSINPYKIDEIDIKENQLVGRAIFKIAPYLGWGKLIFFEYFRPKDERGFCYEN